MSTHTKSGRRTVLQDNSWIRRKAEEDEPIDDDPNFGKVVLSQKKPVDDVSSKSVEAEKTPVNSGTTFSKSPASVNTSISAIVPPPTPAPKPPVPAKNPVLKTPNTSSFNARVFSGANSSSKTLSPVKPSFGEKFPELTASQTTNGAVKSSSVSSPVKTSTRSESVSVSTLKSSTPLQSQTTVTNTKTSSALDESLSSRPAEKHSARTQVRTVHTEIPASSPTLRSPLQTLQSSRVSSRDTCTVCGKPIAGDGRMILEELNIISHTSCFRCAVCRCDLGGLEAGKSLWVLRERVHCSNCFSNIRGQWYI
ncbi:hypothetical protein PO909_005144 [Leuciscus waleckii]